MPRTTKKSHDPKTVNGNPATDPPRVATSPLSGQKPGRSRPWTGRGGPSGASPAPTAAPVDQLRPGQLQSMVLEFMRGRPGEDLSPRQVAQGLNRSSGAVGNALERFVARGLLTRTSATPRRYQAVAPAHAESSPPRLPIEGGATTPKTQAKRPRRRTSKSEAGPR